MCDSEDDFETTTPVRKRSEEKKKNSKKPKIELPKVEITYPSKEEISKEMRKTSGMLVGAHVSIKDGFSGAVKEAVKLGALGFALFTANQRSWNKKPIEPKKILEFKNACEEHGFPAHSIVPHGSYLINLATPEKEKLQKSLDSFIEEMQRCEQLGLVLYNFHPGSFTKGTKEAALFQVADCINKAHAKTKNVVAVIENTAGQGNSIGCSFEEIKTIIEKVEDKKRVGVCIDTCHLFASGYDFRTKETYEKTMNEFESLIGFKHLKAIHLNDSKQELGCRVDRHENIGKGHIGLEAFRLLMNDKRFKDIPMCLETPADASYEKEIALLYSLIGKEKL